MLLGMKKRGFGAGWWNGFGGKIKEGESLIDAAKREVKEESGLDVLSLEEQGVLDFEYSDTQTLHTTHIFSCKEFEGSPQETEEMRPRWFSVDEIPYEDMWPDDKYWFPLLLAGKKFSGTFVFQGTDTITRHSLHEL